MKKKWILPAAAALTVAIAVLVIVLVPKNNNSASPYAERNAEGNVVIRSKDLSSAQVSFIRIGADSKIELLARIGDDGRAKAALGTCQSCNGSPAAYYTQEGSLLKCNNCGLTFPLSVLDAPGGGCHPIMIDTSLIRETQDGLILNTAGLMRYEDLFRKVAAH
jgi:uncharacterized membrane protein